MEYFKEYPIEKLKEWKNNPRKNDKASEKLSKLIDKYGFINPIIIDQDGIIRAGHTRLKSARLLNKKTVPVIQVEFNSEQDAIGFAIADNKSNEFATWDFDLAKQEFNFLKDLNFNMELTGFSEAEVERITEAIQNTKQGGRSPKYEVTDGIYQLGNNYLFVGDSTKNDYSKVLKNDKIQLVYTDPPYGVSYSGNFVGKEMSKIGKRVQTEWEVIQGDDLRQEELYNLIFNSFNTINQYINNTASAYVFHASTNQIIFQQALEKAGWEVKQQLIWKKQFLLSRSHYNWTHEPIFYCSRKNQSNKFYGDFKNKTIIEENLKLMNRDQLIKHVQDLYKNSTIQEYKRDNAKDYIHPTQKPVSMAEYFIVNSTQPNDWVIDMFGGSGSTLIAAQNKKRRCIICEIDHKYASHIIQRFEDTFNIKHKKIE